MTAQLSDKQAKAATEIVQAWYESEDDGHHNSHAVVLSTAIRETKADKLAEALTYARRFLKPKDVDMDFIDSALTAYKEIANV